MAATDFTTTIVVDQSPMEVFTAVNNVRGWWSEEVEGSTDTLNDIFRYQYENAHRCQMKLIEVIAGQKVVWLVLDNYFKFTKDNTEWKGTKISFEITEKDYKTELRFTHVGLVPGFECYEVCSNAWTHYIRESLRDLITTGKGQPNRAGNPQTEDERRLTS